MAEYFRDGMSSLLHRTLLVGQSTFLVRLHVHNFAVFDNNLDGATTGADVTKREDFLLGFAARGGELTRMEPSPMNVSLKG